MAVSDHDATHISGPIAHHIPGRNSPFSLPHRTASIRTIHSRQSPDGTLELVSTWAASTEPDARAQMDPQVQRLVQAFMLRSPQDSDVEELKWHGTHVHRSLTFPVTPGKP